MGILAFALCALIMFVYGVIAVITTLEVQKFRVNTYKYGTHRYDVDEKEIKLIDITAGMLFPITWILSLLLWLIMIVLGLGIGVYDFLVDKFNLKND
jgi:uncharacterized membrane protein YjgN (DUF898 family)